MVDIERNHRSVAYRILLSPLELAKKRSETCLIWNGMRMMDVKTHSLPDMKAPESTLRSSTNTFIVKIL